MRPLPVPCKGTIPVLFIGFAHLAFSPGAIFKDIHIDKKTGKQSGPATVMGGKAEAARERSIRSLADYGAAKRADPPDRDARTG